jgi:CheY-like chemotaxis protein
MVTETPPIVALIDDDKIFRFTTSKILQSTAITEKILQFENAVEALRFISQHLSDEKILPDYIFLDINMPQIDGWMFLDDFETIKKKLPKPVTIYMISSSIDQRDITRAKSNPNVKDYVMKPVTREKFIALLTKAS